MKYQNVCHIVSNKVWGGGEQYVYDLCRQQMADGMHVEVICRNVESITDEFAMGDIPVKTMPLNGVADLWSACRMALAANAIKPCYLHAHNFKDAFTAAVALKMLRKSAQVRLVMCRHLSRPGKNTRLYRWLYRQLHAICFDSELSRRVFFSTHPALDERKVCVVHTSVTVPEKVEPVDLRGELSLPPSTVLAMYHGRLHPEKGLDVLVQAAATLRNKNFRLLLVGEGEDDYTAHLHALIEEKGLQDKVLLLGFRHPIHPYVAAADFGILASTVPEGCPLSPQEYMSQGRPVIATDNGGQKEYIHHRKNGLLVPPGDSALLAEAMTTLIDSADLRQQLGRQAREDFENELSYPHFYRKLQTLYELDR